MRPILCAAALCTAAGLLVPAAHAQSLRIGVEGHAAGEPVQVFVGDVVRLQIIADFRSLRAAGLAAYVTVPEAVFLIQDLGLPGQIGTQPFRAGPLFDGAQLATNLLLPESDDVAATATVPGQQLDLATLFGLRSRGEVSGEGVVATFHVLALSPAEGAVIEIDDNPIRETKIVLSDGRTERRFARTEGLQIVVVDPVASPVEAQGWGRIKRVRTKTARHLSQAAGPW
jgi:hypothetical protein